MDERIKKNILDLNYNKYLQYKITAIIISFTYMVAIVIAWITGQLNLGNYFQMLVVAIFSILILTPSIYFIIISNKHLKRIIELLKS